jgi:hypothetical protein
MDSFEISEVDELELVLETLFPLNQTRGPLPTPGTSSAVFKVLQELQPFRVDLDQRAVWSFADHTRQTL